MTLSEVTVKKPVTTLLVFIVMILLGVYCTLNLPVDMYPDMSLPYMIVITSYNNAGPEEVEQSVTTTMESALSGLSGLKQMQSRSSAGQSLIILEFDYGTNLDSAANEIRDKIDLIRSYLPDDADTPMTIKMDPSMMPIMSLALKGNRTPEELRDYAEDIVKPRLEQLDGIASANISGGREKSINVDVPRDRLEAYGLSISQIAQMIGAQNIQTSGGTITSGETNYTIKTNGKYTSIEDLKNTVVSYKSAESDGMGMPEIKTIRLRDVADVYEGYKTESTLAYLDGNPCVILSLQKQSGKNSVSAAKKVRKAMTKIRAELPNDVEIIESSNTTDIIEQTIWEVVTSVIQGALLAIAVLLIFLRSLKSTIIVGLAIPISVMVTLLLMYFVDITINMISMVGLLLGIGMLVDNSIVVLENIYSYTQKGSKPRVAAILGSQEMVMSITASTLTSVCIFLPMLLFQKQLGMMGELFHDLAYTIIFSLMSSLIVAVALVPVLTSKYLRIDKLSQGKKGVLYGVNNILERFFQGLENGYAKGVSAVLRFRHLFILFLIALFAGAIAICVRVGFILMPDTAADTVTVQMELPKGTKLDVTDENLRSLELMAMNELKGVKYSSITVGGSSIISSSSETNTGSVTFTFYPATWKEQVGSWTFMLRNGKKIEIPKMKKNKRPADWDNEKSAKAKLRRYFDKFPGAKLSFGSNMNAVSTGEISIDVRGDDLPLLRNTAALIEHLIETQGKDVATEVTSDQQEGLPQVEILVDRDRMYELGLNVYNVGSEISAAINGRTASRYTDNGKDIDIVVSLSERDKEKLTDLDQIFVVNSSGVRVPLSSFAHYVENTSPVTIFRQDQGRIIHVTAKPVSGLAAKVVQDRLQQLIDDNIPKDESLTISFSGEQEQTMEALLNFGMIIIMAIILVFVVMASQFESFLDPFIILVTIPLSFIGVITIYAIMREQLSIITVMGILVLVGTIVNNGIVLVDYTNLLRKRGLELREACIEAARNRLRPILMSTLTTVISLAPMAFFPGEGSASMHPISLTVFGGMTFGSLMTLFLMPSIYYMVNSRRLKKAERKRRRRQALEQAQQ